MQQNLCKFSVGTDAKVYSVENKMRQHMINQALPKNITSVHCCNILTLEASTMAMMDCSFLEGNLPLELKIISINHWKLLPAPSVTEHNIAHGRQTMLRIHLPFPHLHSHTTFVLLMSLPFKRPFFQSFIGHCGPHHPLQ